jgi:flagellar hook-associated protein 2
VTGQYQYLQQVGITIGSGGTLRIDEDKFAAAYENDPQGVENLFASFEASSGTTEEIAPGVTVTHDQQNVTTRGFGDIFDNLMEGLTNSVDGTVTLADKNFQTQIDDLNDRISTLDERLAAKRARLEAQFAAMESALAQLQTQSTSLGSLASNIAIARGQ